VIDLWHWEPNAESLALLLCLHELGESFEGHYVDMLALEQHGDAYRTLCPKAELPLLSVDGASLTDTTLALQYLAEARTDQGLRPRSPADWYDLQARLSWLEGPTGLAADMRLMGWNRVMLTALPGDRLAALRERISSLPREKLSGWSAVWADAEASGDQLANAAERIRSVIAKLELALGPSGWLAGSGYSVADIGFYAHLHHATDLLPEIVNAGSTPAVCAWLERIGGRAAVADALAVRRSDLAPVMYAPPGT